MKRKKSFLRWKKGLGKVLIVRARWARKIPKEGEVVKLEDSRKESIEENRFYKLN